MRIAIVGAGIVGVTTAYELAADGHEVTVFERHGSVAAETSFAHAGVISPGLAAACAVPGAASQWLGALFGRHAPLRLRLAGLEPGTLRWGWRWWRGDNAATQRANALRLHRLARYSRERLHDIGTALRLEYEHHAGVLVLLRSAKDLALAQPALARLNELGSACTMLDAQQCRDIEPGLSVETPLHAGIHLPGDEVANGRQFAYQLRAQAQRLGARFCFHTRVLRIEPGASPRVTHLRNPPDDNASVFGPDADADSARSGPRTQPLPIEPITESFDAVVLCAALGATPLLRPLGLRLPLLALHAYSITAPLRSDENHPDLGPRSALVDARHQVTVSRLGSRIRVAGAAEVGGSPQTLYKQPMETLYKVLHDWFPGVARLGQVQRWKGTQPTLPDGPPVLGRSGRDGVWLNLGHGANGWALACGSARLLADALGGRSSAIDTEGLGVERLKRQARP